MDQMLLHSGNRGSDIQTSIHLGSQEQRWGWGMVLCVKGLGSPLIVGLPPLSCCLPIVGQGKALEGPLTHLLDYPGQLRYSRVNSSHSHENPAAWFIREKSYSQEDVGGRGKEAREQRETDKLPRAPAAGPIAQGSPLLSFSRKPEGKNGSPEGGDSNHR